MVVEKRAGGSGRDGGDDQIRVDGERYVRAAEGNGPVNALDRALRARSSTATRTSPTSS